MLTASVIIPTYNRPRELSDCVRSVLDQTVKPLEVLVVDDGRLESLPWQAECDAAGIRYRWLRKDSPGLTASRNLGIRHAVGDILFFLDDDVVLYPDYVEQMLRVFADDTAGSIGGVAGMAANLEPTRVSVAQRLRRLYNIAFLIEGVRPWKVLPSGFFTEWDLRGSSGRRMCDADFLPGGITAYRRAVFAEFSFSEAYKGYGLGEDKDFSFRVGRKFRLAYTPHAKLNHFQSPRMRFDKRELGREFVLSRYRFFRDLVSRRWWNWLFFGYALFGYVLGRVVIMLLSRKPAERERVGGLFEAIGLILRDRV